jgi:predicted nucleotidyltransferase
MGGAEQTALLTRGRTTAKVLALLTSTPGQRFHTREIVRRIDGTEHPVHRALTLLEEQGLVVSQRVGNLRMWSMPTAHPLYRSLREVFTRTVGVAEQLRIALSGRLVELAFIFGSYATGRDDETSDIDLFLLGEADWKSMLDLESDVLARLGRELNPLTYSEEDLRLAIERGSPFFETIRDEPKIWVIGDDEALERRLRAVGGGARRPRGAAAAPKRRRTQQARPRISEPRARQSRSRSKRP